MVLVILDTDLLVKVLIQVETKAVQSKVICAQYHTKQVRTVAVGSLANPS
jgi:hypothetical protein